jgi:hypothetical protein
MSYTDNEATKVSHVYLKSEDNCWIPALQFKSDGETATITIPQFKAEQAMLSTGAGKEKFSDNRIIDLSDYPNKVLPMQNVDSAGNLEEYKDMVELPFLHEVRFTFLSHCERMRSFSRQLTTFATITFHRPLSSTT